MKITATWLKGLACLCAMLFCLPVWAASASSKSTPAYPTPDNRALPWFDSIEVDGNFSIQIQQSQKPHIQIAATHCVVRNWVSDNVLHLKLLPPENAPTTTKLDDLPTVNVIISMPALQNLTLNGRNSITANQIDSQWLDINNEGDNYVYLRGILNVNKINVYGDGNVNLRWVDSKHLIVRGFDAAEITLAGVANILDAKVCNQAHLDAKYLRANMVLVEADNNAIADVMALKSLNAFANQQGNVYYYKTIKNKVVATQMSGNVLQLGNWQ